MICSHEEQEDGAATNNTHLIDWTRTRIVHCEKTAIADSVERVMEELCARGRRPYYIYGDKYGCGNEGTAASAYAKAYSGNAADHLITSSVLPAPGRRKAA